VNTSDKDPFDNLAALNAMVSLATGSEAFKTDQIQAAIEFCRVQAERSNHKRGALAQETAKAYTEVVDRLVKLHLSDPESFGFSHWDLGSHAYDPLWIRAHLIGELKKIAGFREALLLITGLRNAICPPGKYWTNRRSARYREAIAYIENLAVQFKTPTTKLSLLFV
jgi:hypothetical protein